MCERASGELRRFCFWVLQSNRGAFKVPFFFFFFLVAVDILFLSPRDRELSAQSQFTAYFKTHVASDSQVDLEEDVEFKYLMSDYIDIKSA